MDDNQIATEIVNAMKWSGQIPIDKVKVKVEKGWVTLDGELEWHSQKEAARDAAKIFLGVTGVSNNISIKSEAQDQIEKKDIESALKRNWSIDDENINVAVSEHLVTLTGKVNSWFQKEEAERIAYKAPGVWVVDNELAVDYKYSTIDL